MSDYKQRPEGGYTVADLRKEAGMLPQPNARLVSLTDGTLVLEATRDIKAGEMVVARLLSGK